MKRILGVAVCLLVVGVAPDVFGTLAGVIAEFESVSVDGTHKVVVTPSEQDRRGGTISVFRLDGDEWAGRWTAHLDSDYYPMGGAVNDDGSRVVLLDSFGSAGRGVVFALYEPGRKVVEYELKEVLDLEPSWFGLFDEVPHVLHSTSGHWWLEWSLMRFVEVGGVNAVALWVDHHEAWLVWRLDNGEMMEIDDEDAGVLERLMTAEARGVLNRYVQNPELVYRRWGGNDVASAAVYLGQRRDPSDRALLWSCLDQIDFNTGMSIRSTWPPSGNATRTLTSSSDLLASLDRGLAVLSGEVEPLWAREGDESDWWRLGHSPLSGVISLEVIMPDVVVGPDSFVGLALEPIEEGKGARMAWYVSTTRRTDNHYEDGSVVLIDWEMVPTGRYRLTLERLWLEGEDGEPVEVEVEVRSGEEVDRVRIDLRGG